MSLVALFLFLNGSQERIETMRKLTPGQLMAVCVGGSFLATNVAMNESFMWSINAGYDQLAAVLVVTLGTAVALTLAVGAWGEKRRIMALLLLAAWGLGTAWSLSASLQRTASTQSTHTSKVRQGNLGTSLSSDALKDAKRDHLKALDDVAREHLPLCDKASNPARTCPKWYTATQRVDVAQKRIDQHRSQLLKSSGTRVEDPAGAVLEALGLISASRYALLQVLFLPLLLELGSVFLAYGLTGRQDELERALKDLSAKEQFITEYHAAKARGDKPNVVELASRVGASRATGYRWVSSAND